MSALDLSTGHSREYVIPKLSIGSLSAGTAQNSIRIITASNEVIAEVRPNESVFRFCVDASDENAAKFVACIESYLKRQITGIVAEPQPSKEQ